MYNKAQQEWANPFLAQLVRDHYFIPVPMGLDMFSHSLPGADADARIAESF